MIKKYLLKISLASFVIVMSLILVIPVTLAVPPADLHNVQFINPSEPDVENYNETVRLNSVGWDGFRICLDYTTPLGNPPWYPETIGQIQQIGNIWVVVPKTDGSGWTGTFLGPIRPEQTKGSVCNQGEEGISDFLACTINTPIVKGATYGFFLASPARTNKQKQRSNIVMAEWNRLSSNPGAEDLKSCLNIPSPSPSPSPNSHFSCALAEDGVSKYCSNDANGIYTNSTCADEKGESACPTLPNDKNFTCAEGNQCINSRTGIFPDLGSCQKNCSTSVLSGPPEITSIAPAQSIKGAEISVTGKNLGVTVTLFSLSTQSSTSFPGQAYDSSKTLTKFNVPSDLTIGEYEVFVNGVVGDKDYTKTNAKSPTNLTIKEGGDDFQDSPILGIPEGYKSLGELISFIFAWSLRLLGITVFVMIFYAGVIWMTAHGNTGQVGEAKKKMTNAVLGAILLLSAYLILYTVNPDLVGGVLELPGVGAPTQSTP